MEFNWLCARGFAVTDTQDWQPLQLLNVKKEIPSHQISTTTKKPFSDLTLPWLKSRTLSPQPASSTASPFSALASLHECLICQFYTWFTANPPGIRLWAAFVNSSILFALNVVKHLDYYKEMHVFLLNCAMVIHLISNMAAYELDRWKMSEFKSSVQDVQVSVDHDPGPSCRVSGCLVSVQWTSQCQVQD